MSKSDSNSDIHLEVKNLSKSFEGRTVLEHINFHVKKGEIVGLLGPNGAGKTTAFYATIGLIRPDSGEVFLSGSCISKLKPYQRARLGMGFLAQEPSVFRDLTVEENLKAVLELHKIKRSEMTKRINETLGELHLKHLRKTKALVLSGGERRRLEIARALVNKPSFVLLDEPFANIDPITIQDVKYMIKHLSKKGISILITDHNAREIFSITDRCYLISAGSVLANGTPQELVEDSIVRERYLGSDFTL